MHARRRLALGAMVAFWALASACGDSADPSVSVRVTANALVASSLDGPGGTNLAVPAGGSASDVTVVLSAPRTRRSAPAGTVVVAAPVRLSPEGHTFLKVVELTIPIEPSALPPGHTIDDVVVIRAPQNSDAWVPLPTRRSGNAVVCQTEHFSDFLAVVYDAADGGLPFGTCGDDLCVYGESCQICPIDCGLCIPASDVTPPMPSGVSPANGDIGVRGDVVVHAYFSEDLAPASVSNATVTLTPTGGGNAIAGTVTLDYGTVHFTPNAPLAPTTSYTLTVGAVQDLAGNAATPSTSTFVTAAGASLIGSVPDATSANVDPSAPLVFTFTQAIDLATLDMQATDGPCSGTLRLSDDGFVTCIGGSVTANATGDVVTIRSLYDLPEMTDLRLTAFIWARDRYGFDVTAAFDVAFTTGRDTRPPVLLSITPYPGTQDVGPTTPVVLTFDEPVILVDPTSDVSLTDGEVAIAGTSVADGTQVVYTAQDPFVPAYGYYVDVINLTDRAGNAFVGGTVGFFRTIDGPRLATSSPANGRVGVHPRQDLIFGFDLPLDATTLVFQATDGPCVGTVSVSADGFMSCLGGALVLSADKKTLTLRPTSSYPLGGSISVSFSQAIYGTSGFTLRPTPNTTFGISTTGRFGYSVFAGPIWSGGIPAGIAAADAACDSVRPAGVGPTKAFLVSASRHPCADADCASGPAPVDWVLAPATDYVRPDGTLVFTTDAAAPIFTAWPMAATLDAIGFSFVSGSTTQWMPTGNDCAELTAGTGDMDHGETAYTSSASIAFGSRTCDQSFQYLCIEQVPAVLPATH